MKEVIILGWGPSRCECPFDKETWMCNFGDHAADRADYHPARVDKIFLFDNAKFFNTETIRQNGSVVITKDSNIPILEAANIKCEAYPLKEIIAKFGTSYFSTTIPYMIAYAMLHGYEQIDLYGIDHVQHTSYVLEKCGVEYWTGRAEQAGIKVNVSKGSAICKTFNGKLYGYEFYYTPDMVHNEPLMTY